MFKHQLLTAIASVALILSVSPEVKAQYFKTGSPGFTRSIYIPSARNRNTRYGDGYSNPNSGYSRRQNYRGDRDLTIINGGQNCINCRVEDSNYRRGNRRRDYNRRQNGRSNNYYRFD